jgi:ArsR family transcriptional regulator
MVKSGSQTAHLLAWMEALADPTRLRLLRLLERNELTVNDLCDILQLPQSTVSRHLKVLADQKWAKSRAQGTTHLYRMLLDELSPAARKLWLLAREQTDAWATLQQDQMRLSRRLKDRSADAQQFFASAAGKWDQLRTQLYGHTFVPASIAAMLPATYTVADLGCGTGALSEMVSPHVARVLAVDNSPAMLKAAGKHLEGHPNVELLRADLTGLPIADASCDAAILSLVLTYLPEAQPVLTEMARILKPTGKAVIVDLLPHDNDDFRRQMGQAVAGFSPAELQSLLTTAGLTNPIITPLPPEPNTKGPALFLATATKA